VVLHVGYSTLGPKQRLRAWVDLLAATAVQEKPLRAVVVGRRKDDARVEAFGPVDPDRARELLEQLVTLRAVGLQSPIPLPCEMAHAYAEERRNGGDSRVGEDKARLKWAGTFTFPGSVQDPEHVMVLGEDAPFDDVWKWEAPVTLPGLVTGEACHLAALACTIWHPLLDAEGPM
jgi:exodeoxyribonuclease V gamma subunit